MRHKPSEQAAKRAAAFLKQRLKIGEVKIGIVLGTGWGDALRLEDARRVSFEKIPGFGALDRLEGHAREVVFGWLNGTPVIMLRGRIHANERTSDSKFDAMVRLQTEMLLQLGVKRLLLTCAAGSLQPQVEVGSIVLIDGLVTLFALPMPLKAGEFCSPEDTIDQNLLRTVRTKVRTKLTRRTGGHVVMRGPYFEGRKYDKGILRRLGKRILSVGMSLLPEMCVAALYEGVTTVPLAFITNTPFEKHSHAANQTRAKAQSAHLGAFLQQIVALIMQRASSTR